MLTEETEGSGVEEEGALPGEANDASSGLELEEIAQIQIRDLHESSVPSFLGLGSLRWLQSRAVAAVGSEP